MDRLSGNRAILRRASRLAIPAVLIVALIILYPDLAASDKGFQAVPLTKFSMTPVDEGAATSGRGVFRGAIEMRWQRKRFGGFSGLLVDRTGRRLVAVSDRGAWFEAELVYSGGRLVGARKTGFKRLKGTDGEKLKKRAGDAEALSSDGVGGFVVAFERDHRLLHYPGWRQSFLLRPRRMTAPASLGDFTANHGIEAMTRLCDGRYLIVAERPEKTDGKSRDRVWLGDAGVWTPRTIKRQSGFRITGATTLSDCSVAVIERRRRKSPERWITRIQRFPSTAFASGGVIADDGAPISGTVVLGAFSSDAKFEGLAAHPSRRGDVMLFLIADNDFKGPTILAAFSISLKDGRKDR